MEMGGSELVPVESAAKVAEPGDEEKKSKPKLGALEIQRRLEAARQIAKENLRTLIDGTISLDELKDGATNREQEERRKIYNNIKVLMDKYTVHKKKDDHPSLESPSELKENERKRKLPLKTSPVRVKETAKGPLDQEPAKKKPKIALQKLKKGQILCIDLTCEDVEEYFPEKVKVNLGIRCDAPEFKLLGSKISVPSLEQNKRQGRNRNNHTKKAKTTVNTRAHVASGSDDKSAQSQPKLLEKKVEDKRTAKFQMIRVDYKKDNVRKSLSDETQ